MTHRDFFEELIEGIRSLVRAEVRDATPGAGASILSRSGMNATEQILFRLRQQVPAAVSDFRAVPDTQVFTGLGIELETCIRASEQFGEVNPRPSGFMNDRIQSVKRLMRRSMSWYTRPLRLFHGAVIRALQQFVGALEKQQEMLSERALQKDLLAVGGRLDDVEQGTCDIYEVLQSAIETSEAHAQATDDELKAVRADLRDLRRELDSIRQRLKEPMPGCRSPGQSFTKSSSGEVDFLEARSTKIQQD